MATTNETIEKTGTMAYSLAELTRHTAYLHSDTFIRSAFFFAAGAHSEQHRKFSGLPYIIHPVHVACILAKYAQPSSELIVACLLHDTIEDTHVDKTIIHSLFGEQVAHIVDEVTKRDHIHKAINPNISKTELKELERQRLAHISSEGQTLKLGDMYSNTRSMQKENPERFKTYVQENLRLFNTLQNGNKDLRNIVYQMFVKMEVA